MSTTSARVFYSQKGEQTERPLSYTGSPWNLFISDVILFFRNILYIPFLFLPLYPWPNGPMDELSPTASNIIDISFHCVLFIVQLSFLISLPFLTYLPASVYLLYVAIVLGVNVLICRHFNKGIPEDGLKSTEDEYSRQWPAHDDEYWIFLNGICVGRSWLQNNIDRLSRTFHRPVVGVHNKTSGVVFDLVQCLIQRALLFATQDVRDCYVLVKKALYRPGVKKVVLILHSQGGIEGGMILDWLLDEIPQELLQYLEVYTFASIANHFSNPSLTTGSSSTAAAEKTPKRVISHIEHYANAADFGARWGVLNYTRVKPKDHLENRFMGRVFVNPRAGHQLNQHYLSTIFPLDPTRRFTRDPVEGDFMDMDVLVNVEDEWIVGGNPVSGPSLNGLTDGPEFESSRHWREDWTYGGFNGRTVKMRQLSRLWQYRNGGRPGTEVLN